MKYLLLLASAFLISGCDELNHDDRDEAKQPQEVKVQMPEGLKDCKTFRVHGEHHLSMLVTRCPNSATLTQGTGKGAPASLVADDAEPPEDVVQ